jgi:hypothetical protein
MHPDSGDPRACGEAWVADGDQQAVGPHGIARRVLADVDRIASLGASTALRVSAITAQARELATPAVARFVAGGGVASASTWSTRRTRSPMAHAPPVALEHGSRHPEYLTAQPV